jgi:hypothetical protein
MYQLHKLFSVELGGKRKPRWHQAAQLKNIKFVDCNVMQMKWSLLVALDISLSCWIKFRKNIFYELDMFPPNIRENACKTAVYVHRLMRNMPGAVASRSRAWVLAARVLGLWARIPLKAWMFFCVLLSCVGRGLATGWWLIQNSCQIPEQIHNFRSNSELEQVIRSKPSESMIMND